MLKLRQYLCRHDYRYIARDRRSLQNLWTCEHCGVYLIQHWVNGTHYLTKNPPKDEWIYEKEKGEKHG